MPMTLTCLTGLVKALMLAGLAQLPTELKAAPQPPHPPASSNIQKLHSSEKDLFVFDTL